jgi:hypothetical protein
MQRNTKKGSLTINRIFNSKTAALSDGFKFWFTEYGWDFYIKRYPKNDLTQLSLDDRFHAHIGFVRNGNYVSGSKYKKATPVYLHELPGIRAVFLDADPGCEPWFEFADVKKILGLGGSQVKLKDVPQNEQVYVRCYQGGSSRGFNVINRAAIKKLVLMSNIPGKKKFFERLERIPENVGTLKMR